MSTTGNRQQKEIIFSSGCFNADLNMPWGVSLDMKERNSERDSWDVCWDAPLSSSLYYWAGQIRGVKGERRKSSLCAPCLDAVSTSFCFLLEPQLRVIFAAWSPLVQLSLKAAGLPLIVTGTDHLLLINFIMFMHIPSRLQLFILYEPLHIYSYWIITKQSPRIFSPSFRSPHFHTSSTNRYK